MKLFVLYAAQVSARYHSDGGMVVVASDLRAAKALVATEAPDAAVSDEEWKSATRYDLAGNPKPSVRVFPNAGCC